MSFFEKGIHHDNWPLNWPQAARMSLPLLALRIAV